MTEMILTCVTAEGSLLCKYATLGTNGTTDWKVLAGEGSETGLFVLYLVSFC